MKNCVIFFILFVLYCVNCQNMKVWEETIDEDFMFSLLNKHMKLDRYKKPHQLHKNIPPVLSFSWKSCGDPSYPSTVDNITVTPDPIRLPGNVTVGFKGELNVPLDSPVTVDVEMRKKVVFWITVPCIDNFGSCNYQDICQLLPLLNCPPIFQKYGLPCKCPINKGTYQLPPSEIFISEGSIPSFLADGDYQVTAKLSQNKQKIACLYFEFSIAKA